MVIRDRIKELRRVRAGDLTPNPKNWRVHPVAQRAALKGLLREIGYADALLARESADGLTTIDGHLRVEETDPDTLVPVLVLDVTEEEADKVLATLDPLAALAQTDLDALRPLMAEVSSEDPAVRNLLDRLLEGDLVPIAERPDISPASIDEQGLLDRKNPVTCPNCGHEFTA